MEIVKSFIDLFVHLDHHVAELAVQYGLWIYAILFIIIFAETGFVVTPFLPGDSLLFVVGALCAKGTLQLEVVIPLLLVAAISGDAVNYMIGRALASKVKNNERIPFIKQEYLIKTHNFYEKYGPKTIIIARFVPIVRTFAPFMAGVGTMKQSTFTAYNVIGAFIWVFAAVFAGLFFGNLPFVSEHFSLVVLAIVVISLVPAVVEYIKHKSSKTS